MPIPENIAILAVFAGPAVILAFLDHRANWLPDFLTLPLAAAGLLINLHEILAPFSSALIGMIAGYVAIRVLHDLQLLIRGYPGIGLGDAKLLAALGAWLGWTALPIVTVGSAIIMLVFYFRRPEKPFGTGLTAASAVLLTGWPLI